MLYPGHTFESPVPMENFRTEDGKWVFIKQSDHNKIMNHIKNTDPYEVSYDNGLITMRIDGLYYQAYGGAYRVEINGEYNVDAPR